MQFNNLSPGDTLADFAAFYVTPCRAGSEFVAQGSAETAQFWGIYGTTSEGDSLAVHDAADATEAASALAEIERRSGKPVAYREAMREPTPNGTLLELAEHLTFIIHEEIPGHDEPETFRDDDFDAHPLAELREAVCAASGYDGEPMDAAQRHEAEQAEITAAWEAAHPDPTTDDDSARIVGRLAPNWAWEIIDETLSMDAVSKAFDPGLRESVRKALAAMILASEFDDGEPLPDTDPRLSEEA